MSETNTLPPQHQDVQPGIQSEMTPPPEGEAKGYKAAGKLAGKVAVISGGDSGIGRSVAVMFAKEGADVAVLYLNEHEDATFTKRLIENEGRRAMLLAGDIGDAAFCAKAVRSVVAEFGRIDTLVNNAAEQHPVDDFKAIPEEQIERTFRTNVFGMFYLTKYALEHIPAGGTIINTTSVTAFRGSPSLVDYASTKGAILAFTRALSQQLAEKDIRVNCVAPGPIWTPLIPSTFEEQKVAKFGADTTMGRPGQPDEVAPCFVFLASSDSSYMTGQTLHPNGGEIVA